MNRCAMRKNHSWWIRFSVHFRVENEEQENKKEKRERERKRRKTREKGNWRWQEMGRKKEEGDAGKGW